MPEFIMPLADASESRQFNSLDEFTRGYVEAMFFTSTGSGDDGDLEGAHFGELAGAALLRIKSDCREFQKRYPELLDRAYAGNYSPEQAGRDFWFTRNHHGVGFWDRKELRNGIGDALSDCAHDWRELSLYRGDDGALYLE